MDQTQNSKRYDLEERTYQFAKSVAHFVKTLPKTVSNHEYSGRVVRSSGSTGANYIEANEALGKKDFSMRIRICRKEAKESSYWLKLIVETNDGNCSMEGVRLRQEADELKKIFSAIHEKSK
jgi:four helix bundle protein